MRLNRSKADGFFISSTTPFFANIAFLFSSFNFSSFARTASYIFQSTPHQSTDKDGEEKETYSSRINDILSLLPQISLHTLILPPHPLLVLLLLQLFFLLLINTTVTISTCSNNSQFIRGIRTLSGIRLSRYTQAVKAR